MYFDKKRLATYRSTIFRALTLTNIPRHFIAYHAAGGQSGSVLMLVPSGLDRTNRPGLCRGAMQCHGLVL
jgi:hypothetical protein